MSGVVDPAVLEPATAAVKAEPTRGAGFAKRLIRRPVAACCLVFLGALVVIAVAAPSAMPQVAGQQAGDLLHAGQSPTANHLLGTDTLGRDVLQRLMVGVRVTLLGVLEALLVAVALGLPAGIAAGYYGGWADRAVGWLTDLVFSMPTIIIILVALSVFPQSMTAAMVTLGVLTSPQLIRVIRSATIPIRAELYIDAARVAGFPSPYILRRHVLPRIVGPLLVQASMLSAVALIVETGLGYLNLVVAPPAPSWGGMVADGGTVIESHPWVIVPPGLAIAVTVLALGLLGDAVRDVATQTWSSAAPARRSMRRRQARPEQEPSAARPSAERLLSVECLSVGIDSATATVPLLEDVSFDVEKGETLAIVGESGCGKTITTRAILGLLPASASVTGGRVLYGGTDLTRLTERGFGRIRGRRIGLISQEPMIGLNPAYRIGWQLAECVRRHTGLGRAEARTRAVELLQQAGLPDPAAVARRYPHELSGGMAQRVSIARALAGDPELLIADEPTTALDVTVQAEILDLLRNLQRQRGMALVLVTHDWGVVADLADRALVMYAGQVVEQAAVDDLFTAPRHPYTAALLASDPHRAGGSRALPAIPGAVPRPGHWPEGCHFHPRCAHADRACADGVVAMREIEAGRLSRCIHAHELKDSL